MSKEYGYFDQKYINIMNNVIKEEFPEIKEMESRISVVKVSNVDNKTGMTMPAFKGLPYEIKVNGIKDRFISNKDVVFFIDDYFFDRCVVEKEQEALFFSCLNTLEFVIKKEEYVIESDGRPKIRVKKPDFSFEGYSATVMKYKSDSPEMKLYNEIMSDNYEVFCKNIDENE